MLCIGIEHNLTSQKCRSEGQIRRIQRNAKHFLYITKISHKRPISALKGGVFRALVSIGRFLELKIVLKHGVLTQHDFQ